MLFALQTTLAALASAVSTSVEVRSTDSVRGTVVSGTGSPLPDVHVFGVTEIGSAVHRRTDSAGRFALASEDRIVGLIAVTKGLLPARLDLLQHVPPDPSSHEVQLTVQHPALHLEGTLLEHDGRPIPGWLVTAVDEELVGFDTSYPPLEAYVRGAEDAYPAHCTTDAEGRFRIDGLCKRSYVVMAWDPASLNNYAHVAEPHENASIELRVPAENVARDFAVTILSSSGSPVQGAQVTLGLSTGPTIGVVRPPVVTNARGECRLPVLPRQSGYLLVRTENQQATQVSAKDVLAQYGTLRIDDDVRFRVRLSVDPPILVRAEDADGHPLIIWRGEGKNTQGFESAMEMTERVSPVLRVKGSVVRVVICEWEAGPGSPVRDLAAYDRPAQLESVWEIVHP